MKAVTVVESGVQIIDVDTPSPKDSEVLVKVHACGLNRADMVVADGGAPVSYTHLTLPTNREV